MSITDDVKKASGQFYLALNRMANGNAAPMGEIWLHSANVSAMHPIGGRHVGWDEVRGSFEQVAKLASDGKIELRDQLIRTAGDTAYETGIERGRFKLGGKEISVEHRVTNIYERKDGKWQITHHHTDISPAMTDVLKKL